MATHAIRSTVSAMILSAMMIDGALLAEAPGYVPKGGFVPDAKTAIAVAEAILIPIYGKDVINGEKPLRARLDEKGIWTVNGSLPKGYAGGVAELRLSRKDGRILYLTHGK